MLFRQLFEAKTSTYTYLLADEETHEAVLIDPVRETKARDVALLNEFGLKLVYSIETHVHADHVTAAGELRSELGCKTVAPAIDGPACADIGLKGGEEIRFGKHVLQARSTPGHTNGCMSFVLDGDKAVFTGDALLIRSCGRTDFQHGDASKLFDSIHNQIYVLPDTTALYPGHDYQGRTVSSVGEEKKHNPRIPAGRTREEFVKIMGELKLDMPSRILDAVPANQNCGQLQPSPFEIPVGGAAAEVTVGWVASQRRSVQLVDVRSADEFSNDIGHIEGAILAPLDHLEQMVRGWDRQRAIVTVCRSGRRSLAAAALMGSMGFTRVASMAGGMISWSENALEVVRGDAA